MIGYDIEEIKNDLLSSRRKKIILDTDAFCEKDDQFAIAYALLSPDKLDVLAINAAPFTNEKSSGPKDGMEKSYNEIIKVMSLVSPELKIPVFKGSEDFLVNVDGYIESPAADNIIKTCLESEERIYVVGIGAFPNCASALLKCPEIKNKIVVVWLGTNADDTLWEYNAAQDHRTAKVIFDSEAPVVIIPVNPYIYPLSINCEELGRRVETNELGRYLFKKVRDEMERDGDVSTCICDIASIGSIINIGACEFEIIPSPVVTVGCDKMSIDLTRHPILRAKNLKGRLVNDDCIRKLNSVR